MGTAHEIITAIAGLVSAHRGQIYLLSAAIALLFALVLLLPRYNIISENRWTRYVGYAYLIFFFQYGIRFSAWLYVTHLPEQEHRAVQAAPVLISLLFTACSALNNILFLSAARNLLGKSRTVPPLAYILALVSLISMFDSYPGWELVRMPDALFSAYCLGLFGYATSANISFHRHPILGFISLIVGFIYAVINVIYGLSGLIARFLTLGTDTLDTSVFAVALPLKFALFFPAYALFMMLLVSASDLRKVLVETITWRKEYLSGEGIVRTVAQSLGAFRVALVVKIPGQEKLRVAQFAWNDEKKIAEKLEVKTLNRELKTTPLQALEKGREFVHLNRWRERSNADNLTEEVEQKKSLIIVPIRFHGAVIGYLQVEAGRVFFSEAPLQQIRVMAALLGPAVQSYRELAAIDQCGYKFARMPLDAPYCDSSKATEMTGRILHDTLSPLGTAILMNFGFRGSRFIEADEQYRPVAAYLDKRAGTFDLSASFTTDTVDGYGRVEVYNEPIVVTPFRGQHLYQIGTLSLVVQESRDEDGRPTLASNNLHRRAISTMAADALLDAAREYLNSVVKNFSVRLNEGLNTVREWFEQVESFAQKAELEWAVSTQPGQDVAQLSSGGIPEEFVQGLRSMPTHQTDSKNISIILLSETVGSAHHVIVIHLPDSKQYLWLGVSRDNFGVELKFNSPWRLFLEHFAEIADAALLRLTVALEFHRVQRESAQYQGLATTVITTGTLTHQLHNLARDQIDPMTTLLTAVRLNKIKVNDRMKEMIYSMKESAETIFELTRSLANVSRLDDRCPCSLRDAIQHAQNLLNTSLSQRGIRVEFEDVPDLLLDVPFYIAGFTFANLIENAKDAIAKSGTGGTITVKAQENGDMIHCAVIDDGPGIPLKFGRSIFELGVTDKLDSGGWGLYLVTRSLAENRSDITWDEGYSEGARFIVRFPKPAKEDRNGR